MHILLNTRTNEEIHLPEEVDELSMNDYVYYIALAMGLSGEGMDVDDVKRRLFGRFTNLKVGRRFIVPSKVDAIADYQAEIWSAVTDKIALMQSFIVPAEEEASEEVYKLRTDTLSNRLPQWEGWRSKGNLIESLRAGEFVKCVSLLNDIRQLGDGELLQTHLLGAEIFETLYERSDNRFARLADRFKFWREERKLRYIYRVSPLLARDKQVIGELRELIKMSSSDAVRKDLKGKLKIIKQRQWQVVLYHILNWFSYYLEVITTMPMVVAGVEVDFSVLFPKAEIDEDDLESRRKAKGVDMGWNGVLLDVAEAGVFGDLRAVEQEKMIKVLLYLYKIHHQERGV